MLRHSSYWQDGQFRQSSRPMISIAGLSACSSVGVFDGLRVMSQRASTRLGQFIVGAELHIARFKDNCSKLGLACDFSTDDLKATIQKLASDNRHLEQIGLRLFALIEESKNHRGTRKTSIFVFCKSLDGYSLERPYRLSLSTRVRRRDVGISYQTKAMCHYVSGKSVTVEARLKNFDDGLQLNELDQITETPRANIIFISGKEAYSPLPSDGALPGITKLQVRALLEQNYRMSWYDCSIPSAHIQTMDSAFLVSSSLGIVPIERIADRALVVDQRILEIVQRFHETPSDEWRNAGFDIMGVN